MYNNGDIYRRVTALPPCRVAAPIQPPSKAPPDVTST